VELAREVGDPATTLAALGARFYSLAGGPDARGLADVTEEMLELASALGDRRSQAEALSASCMASFCVDDRPTFERHLDALDALARSHHWWRPAALASLHRSGMAVVRGRFAEADEHEAIVRVNARDDHDLSSLLITVQALRALFIDGSLDMDPFVEEILAYRDRLGVGALVRPYRARQLAMMGKLDEAGVILRELIGDDRVQVPQSGFRGALMGYLGDALRISPDRAQARVLYQELLPFQGRMLVPMFVVAQSSADSHLGSLAAMDLRWEDSERHFAAAVELEERWDARSLLGPTNYWFARMLLDRGASGDRPRALDLLASAREIGESVGLPWLVERVDAVAT
jgi:hypothetical protein